jgi:RimJ/RimL family protein N-acetyltransferase
MSTAARPTSASPTAPRLEGDRVVFTPLDMANIYTHFRWNNDPELNRLDSEVPYEEETFGEFKQRFERMCYDATPTTYDFEIHVTGEDTREGGDDDNALIGVAYVADISLHNRHGLVGVTIGERGFWSRGYGRESLELLLAFCFDDLALHRVRAETFEFNAAWAGLVQAAGFVKEGVARDYLLRDGVYYDKMNYALLEPAYREART